MADGAHASRSTLAQAACGHFGFIDARGHAQSAGCTKALRELAQAGHFVLPRVAPSGRGKGKTARRLDAPVPAPEDVPAQAGEVRALALIKVHSLERSAQVALRYREVELRPPLRNTAASRPSSCGWYMSARWARHTMPSRSNGSC